MFNKNKSVHLQDFPRLDFISDEPQLVADMDIVSAICSSALFIRDKKNLRVRLPLQSLTIIGNVSPTILNYRDIIAEEVNVKEILLISEIGDLAEFKLQINFKKIGAKYGNKMKEISAAAAGNDWMPEGEKIKIAGVILEKDEYEIKLITKDKNDNIAALGGNNNLLVQLDIKVTPELEQEGLARDVIRFIQQSRKDADFNISDQIELQIFCEGEHLKNAILSHQNYIAEQTLGNKIELVDDIKMLAAAPHNFSGDIEGSKLGISLRRCK